MSILGKIVVGAGVAVAGSAIARVALQAVGAKPPPTVQKPLILPGNVVALETGSTQNGAPVVVSLHGIDGTEKQLVPYLTAPLFRYVNLRGFRSAGKNFQWMTARLSQSPPAVFLEEARRVVEALRPVFTAIRAQRNPAEMFVVGYSQGGHLAWLLAEAGLVDRALIVAGALPKSYVPAPAKKRTKIFVISGSKDKAVPWRPTVESTLQRFQSAGYEAGAVTVNAGHSLVTIGPHITPGLGHLLDKAAPAARPPTR